MITEWVRVEYSREGEESQERWNLRFIKNMKYCDFIIQGEENFKHWA